MLGPSARQLRLWTTMVLGFGHSPALLAQPEPAFASLTELSLEELLNIQVVSVSKRPEKLSSSPSAIQVITNDQIHRSGATSLPESLRLASNLNVAQQSAHEWIVTSRGFSSDVGNKLLVLMDGRTLYTPLFSGVFWDRQDYLLEDMERIEVVSGPGGTLWGANAVNGVINMLSKNAADTQGGYAEAAAGDRLESQVGMRYGGRVGDGFFRVYGKHTEHDHGKLSNGADGADAWSMGQLGFRMDSARQGRDQLTLQGDYYRTRSQVLTGGESETRGGNILSRWTRRYSENSQAVLQIYFDQTDLVLPVAEQIINGIFLAPAGTFRDKLDTVDIDFHHNFAPWDAHKIVWGWGYRWTYDQVENAPGLGFFPQQLHQDLISAFIQDEIALIENRLALTLGTKVEHNDYTGTEFEPGARLSLNLSEDQMLWGAISRAVRMPSRIDRDINQPAAPNFVILSGGENFDSETVIAYETGYRASVSDHLSLSLALFYNQYSDIRSTSPSPTLFPFYFANNVEGDTQGLELSLNFQPFSWWQMYAGYNYLEQDLRVKPGEYDLNNAMNETADPQNQVSLRSAMNLGDSLALDAAYRWVDQLPVNVVGQRAYVPSYGELDLRLAWALKNNMEIALVGRNLLHDHHQEFGIPGPGQEEISRSVFLKFQILR